MINRKHRGFTVIELVVAMGVFLSLFLIVIVNFRSGESINELKLETQKIASDIRKVQTLAMTGSHYNGNPISVGGYGITFNEGSFTYNMFNDVNNNGMCDDTNGNGLCDIDDDEFLEARSLVNNINSLTFNPTKTDVYIVFKPYSSEISIIADGEVFSGEIEIRIQHARVTGKTGVVGVVPVSGKIDFELQEL